MFKSFPGIALPALAAGFLITAQPLIAAQAARKASRPFAECDGDLSQAVAESLPLNPVGSGKIHGANQGSKPKKFKPEDAIRQIRKAKTPRERQLAQELLIGEVKGILVQFVKRRAAMMRLSNQDDFIQDVTHSAIAHLLETVEPHFNLARGVSFSHYLVVSLENNASRIMVFDRPFSSRHRRSHRELAQIAMNQTLKSFPMLPAEIVPEYAERTLLQFHASLLEARSKQNKYDAETSMPDLEFLKAYGLLEFELLLTERLDLFSEEFRMPELESLPEGEEDDGSGLRRSELAAFRSMRLELMKRTLDELATKARRDRPNFARYIVEIRADLESAEPTTVKDLAKKLGLVEKTLNTYRKDLEALLRPRLIDRY